MGLFYRATRGLLRVFLRAYFREIEVRGLEHLDASGPRVLVANHHNSIIDPLLLVASVERPLAFIAKASLFRIPGFGAALRALGCIPAHRSQDPGYAKENNQKLYEQAGARLAQGLALAMFPEGKSHSDPGLAEFKHGASRIAFEAETRAGGVRIQLAGLHFERTRGFRGRVLVQFAPAIELAPWRERYAADPRGAVAALTEEMHARLSGMILSAEDAEVLRLADLLERMERLEDPDLKEVFDRKKKILDAYAELRKTAPDDVADLRDSLREYRETLHLLGVRDEQVAQDYKAGRVLGYTLRNTVLLALALPFVAAALVGHFPPYLLSWTSTRLFGRLPDRQATAAFVAALLAYPLWWAALAWAGWRWVGVPGAAAVLAVMPPVGLLALLSMDRWHRVLRESRALWAAVALPAARARLRRMRRTIVVQALRLAERSA